MPDNDPQKVRLQGVRLSFPNLFNAKAMEEGKTPKFGANFLLHKVKDRLAIKAIQKAIDAAVAGEWPKGTPKSLKGGLRECAEKDYEGYDEEHVFISTSSTRRPVVVGRKLEPLVASDVIPYAGCYVNATVRTFAWEHKTGGKGVSFDLMAVQFVKDGESFGGGAPVVAEKEFAALDDEDEDDDI